MITMAEVELMIQPNAIWVGVGTMCAIVGGAMLAMYKVTTTLSSIDGRLGRLESRLAETYSRTEAMNHAMELAMANPKIRVPRPDIPGEFYTNGMTRAVTDT